MVIADGKFSTEMEGDVSFPWTEAQDSHHGSVLNSLNFITEKKNRRCHAHQTKTKKIKGFNSLHTLSLSSCWS